MSKAHTRINWLVILQGWAMLWVVIGHSPLGVVNEGPIWENYLYRFAYSFHMPLFMLISGWLFYFTRLNAKRSGREWSYNQIVIDKIFRLLLPGLVFSIIAFLAKLLFPGEVNRQIGLNTYDIIHAYLYPYDNPLRELWFIVTLFWFFVITPLWKCALQSKWFSLVTFIVLLFFHFYPPSIGIMCLNKVFSMAIWFFMGLLISKGDIVCRLFENNSYYTFVGGIVIYIIGYICHFSFITTIGGIVLSFGLSLIADRVIPKLFFTFRNYTYQIFLMGIFAQIAIKVLYKHFEMPYILGFIICVLAGLYIPVMLSKMIEKINYFPLLLCVGLKGKKDYNIYDHTV